MIIKSNTEDITTIICYIAFYIIIAIGLIPLYRNKGKVKNTVLFLSSLMLIISLSLMYGIAEYMNRYYGVQTDLSVYISMAAIAAVSVAFAMKGEKKRRFLIIPVDTVIGILAINFLSYYVSVELTLLNGTKLMVPAVILFMSVTFINMMASMRIANENTVGQKN